MKDDELTRDQLLAELRAAREIDDRLSKQIDEFISDNIDLTARAVAAEARAEAAEAEAKRLRGFAQWARDIAIADRQSPQREIETVIRLARAALSPAEGDASSGSADKRE